MPSPCKRGQKQTSSRRSDPLKKNFLWLDLKRKRLRSAASPLGSLDADHPHVLRVVRQLAVEALVLQDRPDVVPVVFGDSAPDGQVVRITWREREREKGRLSV